MRVEIVEAWTSDGVRLQGVIEESGATTAVAGIDALILFSGVGSNFYSASLIANLATTAVNANIAALRVNTRGHDMISTAQTRDGGRLAGAAYEIVDDCRFDVAAWVGLLVDRGYQRVGLLGHSLGALKVLYSQAKHPHPAVAKVIAVSPPRLSHDAFLMGPQSHEFRQSFRTASELAESGRSDELFRATFPFPLVMSAATYLDKYGPESRYDLTKFASDVDVPVSFVFGELELQSGGIAFAGIDERVRELDWKRPPVVRTIAEANHFYAGVSDCLCEVVVELLQE
ncbi:MAG: alpha/beta fold hydrolase [Planctomycetota bacterium]|jgi:pimeloyl-ACP methyl ester carboxylesterase